MPALGVDVGAAFVCVAAGLAVNGALPDAGALAVRGDADAVPESKPLKDGGTESVGESEIVVVALGHDELDIDLVAHALAEGEPDVGADTLRETVAVTTTDAEPLNDVTEVADTLAAPDADERDVAENAPLTVPPAAFPLGDVLGLGEIRPVEVPFTIGVADAAVDTVRCVVVDTAALVETLALAAALALNETELVEDPLRSGLEDADAQREELSDAETDAVPRALADGVMLDECVSVPARDAVPEPDAVNAPLGVRGDGDAVTDGLREGSSERVADAVDDPQTVASTDIDGDSDGVGVVEDVPHFEMRAVSVAGAEGDAGEDADATVDTDAVAVRE